MKVSGAGFEVTSWHFNDSVGILGNVLVKIFGYNNSMGLGGTFSLKLFDKFVYPISIVVDKLLTKHLFGKSLLIFATKEGNLS